MRTRSKIILTTLVFTIIGFMLGSQAPVGSQIWPANPSLEEHYGAPTSAQVGLLMTYGLLSSIAFGAGVSFILFGWPLLANSPVSRGIARFAFVGIAWLLVSWVPHDALHQHIASIGALTALEFGFHLTLQIAGIALALYFVETIRGARSTTTQAAARADAGAAGE